eukprot:1155707-Pelagomonas_calceolata.AAC.3
MSWASCTEGHTSVRVNFLLTVAVAHGCTAAACATPSSTRTSRRPVMGVDAFVSSIEATQRSTGEQCSPPRARPLCYQRSCQERSQPSS